MLTDSYRALRTCAVLAILVICQGVVLTLGLEQIGVPRPYVVLAGTMTLLTTLVVVRVAMAFDARFQRALTWKSFR